jgi:hypothetical protein
VSVLFDAVLSRRTEASQPWMDDDQSSLIIIASCC